jgi:pimeloyl-ACP methyl ester carboxylesterase
MADLDTFYSPRPPLSPAQDTLLLFFIPGNPGVVGYYEPFLSRLSALVAKSRVSLSSRGGVSVYGRSLSGFCAGPELGGSGGGPVGLAEQVLYVEDALFTVVRGWSDGDGDNGGGRGRKTKVILIGHSMGGYVLLELLRRYKSGVNVGDIDIIGGIFLFPTIADIAKSPLGLKYNVSIHTSLFLLLCFPDAYNLTSQRILHLPHFALLISVLVKILVFFIPTRILCGLVGAVMRYPPHAARATAGFLKGKGGVRGSL